MKGVMLKKKGGSGLNKSENGRLKELWLIDDPYSYKAHQDILKNGICDTHLNMSSPHGSSELLKT